MSKETRIRWYPRTLSHTHAMDRLSGLTSGVERVVAIEVYDHPDSHTSTRGPNVGRHIGPWLMGPEDECRAELAERGFHDWEIKAAIGLVDKQTTQGET